MPKSTKTPRGNAEGPKRCTSTRLGLVHRPRPLNPAIPFCRSKTPFLLSEKKISF